MGNKLNDTGLRIVWDKVWQLIKSITGDVNVTEKGTLQKQIDDCFQSVSDGKALVASAITDKGVSTEQDAAFATMAENIAQIKTQGTMQAKTASLSTSAQTIKPDTGYDGLSQVVVPAVNGTAGTGDVVASKTFSSASGINQTGTLADKTGTTDHQATASLDTTNNRLKLKIPALGKYGTGNYLYAAYSTIASLIGLTANKFLAGNTILGIAGGIANKAGTTVAAASVVQDDNYTYFGIPEAAFFDTTSKISCPNSNLSKKIQMCLHATGSSYTRIPINLVKSVKVLSGNFYMAVCTADYNSNSLSGHYNIAAGASSGIYDITQYHNNYNTLLLNPATDNKANVIEVEFIS